MAILSPEAKNNAKPLINALWTSLTGTRWLSDASP